MNARALGMIEGAIAPIIARGRKIERLKMVVCPDADIASHMNISTRYGSLRVEPNLFCTKGTAYVIEDPGLKGRGFAWVSRRKEP